MTVQSKHYEDPTMLRFTDERRAHWDQVAQLNDEWSGWGGTYHQRLHEIYQFVVSPGQRVLEVGCGQGDLLAALQPSVGLGIDFSTEMIERAQKRHPHLTFIQADAHTFDLEETFDIVILSDLVNDVWDVQVVLERLKAVMTPRSRLVINSYSYLWEMPLRQAQFAKLARPRMQQNWLTVTDIDDLLQLAGFEVIKHWDEVLLPLPIPLLERFSNRYLVKIWPFQLLSLAHFFVARPTAASIIQAENAPKVSVIVPARNEAGNISAILERVPNMGSGTEIIFVEGHSHDDTYEVIQREVQAFTRLPVQLHQQTGVGKGDAVRLGFREATGDVLMILDADLTVPPEDLPKFYEALVTNKAEFVNGIRLVYPMEAEAMRFFNLLGNKFFSLAFSWLLEQSVKDTLCGTKVLWKRDYIKIANNRDYFGDFDPFGDFDLLLGAAKQGYRIIGLPIRYRERTYGDTNIDRWKHGAMLLRMVLFAARRMKFV